MKVLKCATVIASLFLATTPLMAQQTIPELLQQIKDDADKITGLLNPTNPPVNCVQSAFSLKQPPPAWGTCTNGTQSRSETWERTTTTPASNGGTACGPLSETRIATQSCGVTPPPPTGTPTISGVSGSLTNGGSVSIAGTNFGTKAAQQPWKWDDMNGASGAHMEPRGWLVHQNTPQPTLSTVQKRPGHTTSVQLGQTGDDVPDFAFGDNAGNYLDLTSASAANLRTPPSNILIDYWMYFINGSGIRNFKFWRYYGTAGENDNRYWGMPDGSSGSESSEMGYFNAIGVSTLANKWTHHRVYLHPDSVQANVYFQHSIDQRIYMNTGTSGNYVPPDPGFSSGPWPTGGRVTSFIWEMQSLDGGSPIAKMYIQDVAVDEGYGAVYLGNSTTWSATTHTEYQPYTVWTNGSVTVKLNKGTFGAGQAWVYIVNNGRLVNASGFSVILQ